MRIAVLGAGAWGSALAISLSARHQISLWSKDPNHAIEMDSQRINQSFLPGYPLPKALRITSILNDALGAAELALIVVPIAGLRETLRAMAASKIKIPIIWGVKGLNQIPHICRIKLSKQSILPYCLIAAYCPVPVSQRRWRKDCQPL